MVDARLVFVVGKKGELRFMVEPVWSREGDAEDMPTLALGSCRVDPACWVEQLGGLGAVVVRDGEGELLGQAAVDRQCPHATRLIKLGVEAGASASPEKMADVVARALERAGLRLVWRG